MAILRVAQMGHPVLRAVAEPVDPEIIPTEGFQQFCDDMLETMAEYDGVGLAAPQVYTSARVVVLVLDEGREPEFFINPVITPLTEDVVRTVEGCLSVHALRAAVERPASVRIEALDRDGSSKAYELHGFPAVVVQHECDHLDGILYVDRCDTRTLAFLDEYRRHGTWDDWQEEDDEEDLELEEGEESLEAEAADEAEASGDAAEEE